MASPINLRSSHLKLGVQLLNPPGGDKKKKKKFMKVTLCSSCFPVHSSHLSAMVSLYHKACRETDTRDSVFDREISAYLCSRWYHFDTARVWRLLPLFRCSSPKSLLPQFNLIIPWTWTELPTDNHTHWLLDKCSSTTMSNFKGTTILIEPVTEVAMWNLRGIAN